MKLAGLFKDHMVVQQGRPFAVWGWAEAYGTVTVNLAGHRATAVAGSDGAWRVTLPALPPGGTYELNATGDGGSVTVRDVLAGEVWICSGQSNMEWQVVQSKDAAMEIASADDPLLRMFTVPHTMEFEPAEDIKGEWAASSPQTAGQFSGVGYFFARMLRRRLGIPVGMIHTSWGGTTAEAWTSRQALESHPELAPLLKPVDQVCADPACDILAWQQKWNVQRNRLMSEPSEESRNWAQPGCDQRDWLEMNLPASWQGNGIMTNGVFWFRIAVDVPASWVGKALTLRIGAVDKSDITYFNGAEVGRMLYSENMDSWRTPRCYPVPAHLVRPGRNVIAVRVFSHIYFGGLGGPAPEMCLTSGEGESIPLAGVWHYKIEEDHGDFSEDRILGNPLPTTLFNAMVHPLIPGAIRGAIWYQGESNVGRAAQYRTLFQVMIRDWRARWGQGDFPFYFVQLANHTARHDEPRDSAWADLREAQTAALALPNTGMAVTIDVGEADDIHPNNKQDVGERLACWALVDTYGQEGVRSGPLFKNASIEGNTIRISFDHAGGGLVARGGELTGFAIAGADRQYTWAEARIEGNDIVVSSPKVTVPVAVRYAWADNPACNLYNTEGLPASPFRTDHW